MDKLTDRQKALIAEVFDPKPQQGSQLKEPCPKEKGYMKDGKCIPHKMAKEPSKASLKKSIMAGLKGQTKTQKKWKEDVKKDLKKLKSLIK